MKKEFLKILEDKGFDLIGTDKQFGMLVYQTKLLSDGWSDGFSNQYILTFVPSSGIGFTIDKYSCGGFCGNQENTTRLFDGSFDKIEEFELILKFIGFSAQKQ